MTRHTHARHDIIYKVKIKGEHRGLVTYKLGVFCSTLGVLESCVHEGFCSLNNERKHWSVRVMTRALIGIGRCQKSFSFTLPV